MHGVINSVPPPTPPPPPPPPPSETLPSSAKERQACAACRHQRKKCTDKCAFAPYFPSTAAADFEAVQKLFGVSNMTKLVSKVPAEDHARLFATLVWEARGREQSPTEGCYAEVQQLQQENEWLRSELAKLQQRFYSMVSLYENLQHSNGNGNSTRTMGVVTSGGIANGAGNGMCVPLNGGTVLLQTRRSDRVVNGNGWYGLGRTSYKQGPAAILQKDKKSNGGQEEPSSD